MKTLITFDDVVILPKFSNIKSRADIDLSCRKNLNIKWTLPIISANMDTITTSTMANAMHKNGAIGCLHRFWSIEDNVKAFLEAPNSWVSVGIGNKELERAKALYEVGARVFVIDVANGASSFVADRYLEIKDMYPDTFVIVGNFATAESVEDFHGYLYDSGYGFFKFNDFVDGIKVGVSSGSSCSTRLKTGVGVPQVSAVQQIREVFPGLLISDGGHRTSGDCAKSLASGADLIMVGNLISGTTESPGETIYENGKYLKKYRGSASKESYEVQGKNQDYITDEGESFMVEYKGQVAKVLKDIEGGLRSSFSYVGAKNIKEFHEKAELCIVTSAGYVEGTPHGKK